MLTEPPFVEHARRQSNVVHDLDELLFALGRQHDLVEVEHRLDPLGEMGQALRCHVLARADETGKHRIVRVGMRRAAAREEHCVFETVELQRIAVRHRRRRLVGEVGIRSGCRGPDCRHARSGRERHLLAQRMRHSSEQPDHAGLIPADYRGLAARTAERCQEETQTAVFLLGALRAGDVDDHWIGHESRHAPDAARALLDRDEIHAGKEGGLHAKRRHAACRCAQLEQRAPFRWVIAAEDDPLRRALTHELPYQTAGELALLVTLQHDGARPRLQAQHSADERIVCQSVALSEEPLREEPVDAERLVARRGTSGVSLEYEPSVERTVGEIPARQAQQRVVECHAARTPAHVIQQEADAALEAEVQLRSQRQHHQSELLRAELERACSRGQRVRVRVGRRECDVERRIPVLGVTPLRIRRLPGGGVERLQECLAREREAVDVAGLILRARDRVAQQGMEPLHARTQKRPL